MKKMLLIIGLIMGIILPSLAQSPLCASYPTSFCCEYVSEVSINGAVRTGPTGYSTGENAGFTGVNGYYDYTSSILTSMVAGNTYPVSVTVKTNSTYQEYVKIWFDFNGNGSLSDAGELMFDQVNEFDGTQVYSGNVTVPASAFNGEIYIRVVMVYANVPALCGSYSYGTTLDFKANISGGVTSRNLSVTANGTGGYSGSVTSSPAGINTASGFNSANYNDGSVVNLTAATSGGSIFTGWSGDATGTTNPLAVTMNAAKSITANFGPPATTPILTTTAISSIGTTTAISGGNISSSSTAVSARGVCWNTSSSPTISNSKTSDGTGTGVFSSSISGLLPGTTYYVRAYATNTSGTAYGNELSFSTIKNSQTITFNSLTNSIYGDDELNLSASASSGLACTYVSSNTNVATIDGNQVNIVGAGTTQITASQNGNSNYYAATAVSQNLTVGKKSLVVSTGSQNKIYGDPNPSFTVSYSGFVNGETQSALTTLATLNCTANLTSNAGLYSIIPSGATDENYNFTYNNGILTVFKAPLTVSANNLTRVYGATNPSPSLTISGFKNGELQSVLTALPVASIGASSTSSVGTYPITASGGSDENYYFTFVNGTMNITKAMLNITAADEVRTYGSTNPTFAVNYSGFANSETQSVLTTLPSITCAATVSSNAGVYDIVVNGANDENYDFNYSNGALYVAKATLTVSSSNWTKEYGDAMPVIIPTYVGFVNNDNESNLTIAPSILCSATINSSYGVYPIILYSGDDDNYDFDYIDGTLSITKANLTVSANNISITYGDNIPILSYGMSGFKNNEDETVLNTNPQIICLGNSLSNAGNYQIILYGGDANNYNFNYVDGILTINKAMLTLAANDASMIYGDNLPQLTYAISGFRNNEDVSVLGNIPTMTCFEGPLSNAGTYPIYIDNNSATNYDFGYLHGTLSINKAILDVTAQNVIKVYGETNPNFHLILAGFKNNENISVIDLVPVATVSTDEYSHAGIYPILINGGSDNNYEFNYLNGELTINKALLTVTADNLTKVYGEPDLPLTYSYSGFVNSENTGAFISDPIISCSINDSGNAGVYPIELSGGSADNYDFNLINGIYTILKAPLFVSTNNGTKTYGEINPIFNIHFNGFIGIENTNNLTTIPTVSCAATEFSAAGIYPVELTGGIDENYDFIYQNGELKINKANLYVAALDTSRYFNTPNPEFDLIYMGFVNNEDVSVLTSLPIATTTATQASAPGIYPIELNGGNDENYNFNYSTGFLTILFSVNVETHENVSISIYPNPTRNFVNITNLKNCQIKMMDITGKLIYSKSSCNGNQKINVSNLPAGIYMVELKGDNINKTQKLVVN